jgi:hypothetical protein
MNENQAKTIRFDFESFKWEGLTIEQLQIWEKLYPHADIPKILKVDIPRWLDKMVISREPLKVKVKGRKKDWKKTIVNWLKKEDIKEATITAIPLRGER